MSVSVKELCTFRVDHLCNSISYSSTSAELVSLAQSINDPIIIGGGSNILFVNDVERDIIVVAHEGIELVKDLKRKVNVKINAGTSWHDLVMWAIRHDYGGIENLSLIPGKCGAAPMQNIGAYGIELEKVFIELECIEIGSGKRLKLKKEDCLFGYRDSIFKNELRGKVIIDNITIELSKTPYHKVNTTYGAISSKLEENEVKNPSIKDVSDAVVEIRKSKLPDPKIMPNAGSFFKNPVISTAQFDVLKESNLNVPWYSVSDDYVKIPAGWLIDQAGWKGKILNGVGTYKNQALVIINHSIDDGRKIYDFSETILQDVYQKFGVSLEREVNVYGL